MCSVVVPCPGAFGCECVYRPLGVLSRGGLVPLLGCFQPYIHTDWFFHLIEGSAVDIPAAWLVFCHLAKVDRTPIRNDERLFHYMFESCSVNDIPTVVGEIQKMGVSCNTITGRALSWYEGYWIIYAELLSTLKKLGGWWELNGRKLRMTCRLPIPSYKVYWPLKPTLRMIEIFEISCPVVQYTHPILCVATFRLSRRNFECTTLMGRWFLGTILALLLQGLHTLCKHVRHCVGYFRRKCLYSNLRFK